MARASRLDENHTSIVTTLRSVKCCTVQSLAGVRHGVPDLLVGFRGKNFLLEVKTENSDLNENEVIWHERWKGQKRVVRSSLEALLAVGLTYREASKIFKKLREPIPDQPSLPGAEDVRGTENAAPLLVDGVEMEARENNAEIGQKTAIS